MRGVLIDWGGVLTTGLSESIAKWIETDRIDGAHYLGVMRELVAQAYDGSQTNLVHALERGELDGADFERDLAAKLITLDGVPPVAEGLISRMFAGFEPVTPMYDMLRTVRMNGLKTCLLSNSWSNTYPRELFDGLFDAVVISAEVGMRKPEPAIFQHALELVALPGEDCVFIDDLEANIVAARALGITGIHHSDPDTTLAQLESLLRLPLRRA